MFRCCVRTLLRSGKIKLIPPKKTKTLLNNKLNMVHESVFTRQLHLTTSANAAVLPKIENNYAYNILEQRGIINQNVFPPPIDIKSVTELEEFNALLDQNWRWRTASEIVNAFRSVTDFCVQNNINVSDTRFNKLTDGLMDQVLELTDAELSALLVCLKELPSCDSFDSNNYHDIWSALDDVCCSRIGKWPNETRFLFADHFYHLHLGKLCDFVCMLIDRLAQKAKYLTKPELIYLFVLLKSTKRSNVTFNVISSLNSNLEGLSLEELSFIADTLVKRKAKPKHDNTIQYYIDRLNSALPDASDSQILNIVEVRKACKYTSTLLTSLHVPILTKNELIRTFFYFNVCRTLAVDDARYEKALNKIFHQLSINEIGIIAMGYFKSRSIFKSKYLLSLTIHKVQEEIHTIHEITLSAILKLLRYSTHPLFVDQLMCLLDNLVPEIPRLSNLCCVHIALLGTTLHFFHEKSLKAVSNKISKDVPNVEKVRLKDMERLLVALTMFNYDPKTNPDIYDTIFKELHTERRRKEIFLHPRTLLTTLQLLTMRKMYSYELMNELLDMDKIIELYGKQPKVVPINLLYLDVGIDIDCPDYNGKRLNQDFRRRALKWHVAYFPTWNQFKKLTQVDKFTLNVKDVIAKVTGGDAFIHIEHVLPNYVNADIIICKDERGNFVKPSGFNQYTLGDVMKAPDSKLKWFAFVPVSWHNQVKHTRDPLGLKVTKCQQLKTIGYEPILIHWNEFNKGEDEQIEIIRNKML